MTAAEVEAARRAAEQRPPPEGAEEQPPPAAPRRRRRRRRVVTALVSLAVVVAVIAGLWIGSRQFWFVGTDQAGLIALYRGLPYQLPLGIKLYSERYQSGVPSSSLPALQRKRVLDHQLRGRSDAADLVRSLERSYAS
jgi:protein phosphatase